MCTIQLATASLLVEEERLEAAALLWHEASWASDKALLRKKSLTPAKFALSASSPQKDGSHSSGMTLGAALQPVCDDVRACLHDDIKSLRSLLLNTAWLLKTSSPTAAAATTAENASISERKEGEVAIMHLMYKISDARSLANARIDLASGRDGCPPPLVLDLWSDVISYGISLVAESRVTGKYNPAGTVSRSGSVKNTVCMYRGGYIDRLDTMVPVVMCVTRCLCRSVYVSDSLRVVPAIRGDETNSEEQRRDRIHVHYRG